MSEASKIIELAKNEVGYYSKDGRTKYAKDLDLEGAYYIPIDGYDWCAVFVHWLFLKQFGFSGAKNRLHIGDKSHFCSCTYAVSEYKKMGSISYMPKTGSQVFFTSDGGKSFYHTGIVIEVKGNEFTTIEGNSRGRVRQNKHWYNGNNAVFFTPNYRKEETRKVYKWVSEVPEWARPLIQKMWDKGILKGNDKGELCVTDDMLIMFQVMDNCGMFDR